MRFDQKIKLVKEGTPIYNPQTGNYDSTEGTEQKLWVNVSDMTEERMSFLFGGLKQGAYTIRLQGQVLRKFDYVEMNGKKYNVNQQRVLRRFTTLQVSERL